MKVWKNGLTPDKWRIVRSLEKATHCTHGRPLIELDCDDCKNELQYDGDDDRPWRAARVGSDGVYCPHGVSLDSACEECRQEKIDEGADES